MTASPAFHLDLTGLNDSAEAREALLRREWFLTNGLGGFASGTPLCIPQRRYHNFLIGALRPPVGRVVGLSSVVEGVTLKAPPGGGSEQRIDFSSFAFPSRAAAAGAGEAAPSTKVYSPGGHSLLQRFEKDVSCRWSYRYGPVEFTRELALARHENAAVLRYTVTSARAHARLELRPLTALRDFHELVRHEQRRNEYSVMAGPSGVEIASRGASVAIELTPGHAEGSFVQDRQWWFDLVYARDQERGQDGVEDLFSPGVFRVEVPAGRPTVVEIVARMPTEALRSARTPRGRALSCDEIVGAERERLDALAAQTVSGLGGPALSDDERVSIRTLVADADQFVVRRERAPARPAPTLLASRPAPTESDVSVIAGYPWFSDWGRDTMISLPGLLLVTGRLDEAARAMNAFAALTRRGLVPNCFDNGTGEAEYNTVDASLWYLQAAANLHAACVARGQPDPTDDSSAIRRTCLAIIEAYQNGTDFNIKADPRDGLISAGEMGTQLTWMDAKRDGVVFTPRHGKPVEINALWYSGLHCVADLVEKDRPRTSRELRQVAERVGKSFREQFWNADDGCLFDVLAPRAGSFVGVREVRPNQIFACSLPHSPLEQAQQQSVLKVVQEHLLTPRGLRTLSSRERGYIGFFEGPLFDRDRAYHNGTVWPWLLGPYAESVLRVGKFSERSRALARDAIQPLLDMIAPSASIDSGGPAIGQIPEIYDGDERRGSGGTVIPRRPDGCFAQAWSVAECLRVLSLCLARPSSRS